MKTKKMHPVQKKTGQIYGVSLEDNSQKVCTGGFQDIKIEKGCKKGTTQKNKRIT